MQDAEPAREHGVDGPSERGRDKADQDRLARSSGRTFVLGALLVYGATKAGYLGGAERARLDRATEERQRQEDSYKRRG